MLKHVNNNDFKEMVLENKKPILVDFFATWCPPCKMLSPVLEEIATKNETFDIAKINIDENQELAIKYGIEVVPTMLIFKNGIQMDKVSGFMDEEKILNLMSQYI